MTTSSIHRLLALTNVVLLPACAEFLDLPPDPQLMEAVLAEEWRCLDDSDRDDGDEAPPVEDLANVQVRACNFVSTNCATPVTGLSAQLCNKRDVKCSNPIRRGLMDMGGQLSFDVATGGSLGSGFDGYLMVTAPTEACTNGSVFGPAAPGICELVPGCDVNMPEDAACQMPTFASAMLFFNPAIRASLTTPLFLPLVPTVAIPSLLEASGSVQDPQNGMLFVTIVDCDGKPASNTTLSIDAHQDEVTMLYIDHGVISRTAKSTDASGTAGVANVPPGFMKVSAYATDEERTHVGDVGVQIAPFTITYATLIPGR
jgi:hypothetical protein